MINKILWYSYHPCISFFSLDNLKTILQTKKSNFLYDIFNTNKNNLRLFSSDLDVSFKLVSEK